ncbi:hypothetical protein P4C99_09175 [Pontiellaceae bacterium B1224]|nr:hypothetical protein [Pontiellaceae bacterium B1224]
MISISIIRKIGKMLRGGAGKREIFLGALCGVLIGMLPGANLMLAVLILAVLLLNSNLGFTLLGVAFGKILCLTLAIPTFHIGYTIIHNIGLEGVFTSLANMPGLALMGLDNYSQVGGAPIAWVVAFVFAKALSTYVNKIREQMVKAAKNEKVGKATGNKFSKFLIWLAFGKQKISTEDVLAKTSPLFRKSGIILVAAFLVIGLLFEFLFLDMAVKKAISSSISRSTGAEVNMDKAHLSIFGGELDIQNLQVTDPDKPTHNLVQIGQLVSDISVSDLLRKSVVIDLLAGSVLQTDTLRDTPGKLLVSAEEKQKKTDKKAKEKEEKEKAEGEKTLDDYLAQADKYKEWLDKASEYLEKQKKVSEFVKGGPPPTPSRDELVELARKIGYLNMTADLLSDRPAWLIRNIEIDQVTLSSDLPMQEIIAAEVCSNPALNGQPTLLEMISEDATEATFKMVLRFDDMNAPNDIAFNLKGIDMAEVVETGDSLQIETGIADLSANGTFSTDSLDIPFSLTVRELKTSNEIINNLKNIALPGKLYGSLTSPRITVEIDDNLKNAAIDAAKARANEEVEKAKAAAQQKADEQINKALESEKAQDIKNKASEGLKKFGF